MNENENECNNRQIGGAYFQHLYILREENEESVTRKVSMKYQVLVQSKEA